MADRFSSSKTSARRAIRFGHLEVVRSLNSTPLMDTFVVRDSDGTRILRLLAPWLSDDAPFRTNFERMAPSMVELDHPNLGRTFEFGVVDNRLYTLGEHFFTPSVRSMNRMLNARATFTTETVRRIAFDLCHALHTVHTLKYPDGEAIQLLYRDPLAGYIFFQSDGEVVFRDPGPWAQVWSNLKRYQIRDRSTDPFRAPEDLRGEDLDARSDLFALARTLLIMLNPVPLHSTSSRVRRHLDDSLALLRAEDPAFADVLSRALRERRDERFASAAEMADAMAPLRPAERARSNAEAQQFIEETRSSNRKKPDELTSSLRNIERVQRILPDPAPASRSGDIVRRRAETIDIPIDSFPDLKALRDHAARQRPKREPFSGRPDAFDAPPPTGIADRTFVPNDTKAISDPTPEALAAPTRTSFLQEALPSVAPRPKFGGLQRAPDPRVQTLAQAVRDLIHRPDAALLRSAAQQRLIGDSQKALETLARIPEDAAKDIRAAARLEQGFALIEVRDYAAAEEILTPCREHLSHASDQALLAYYLGLAAMARGDRTTATERLESIPSSLRSRFPDLSQLFSTLNA